VVDLHLHTTASDGLLKPEEVVDRAHKAGIRNFSVTDHDTMAGVSAAAAAASKLGLYFLPGIEVTAVIDGRDVHVLGYFLDISPPNLDLFLRVQRDDRIARARAMAEKLKALGMPIPIDSIVESTRAKKQSLARPLLARALADAGYVNGLKEAFDRWIGDRGPAYVPRKGSSPEDVVRLISRAGGVSSLAHPGLLKRDDLVPSLKRAGLAALEVYHPSHHRLKQAHYRKLSNRWKLLMTGGSDFHGDDDHRASSFGSVGLPDKEFRLLVERLHAADSAVHT
jgi:predicted metal-dependent phosphoesterase TrpH